MGRHSPTAGCPTAALDAAGEAVHRVILHLASREGGNQDRRDDEGSGQVRRRTAGRRRAAGRRLRRGGGGGRPADPGRLLDPQGGLRAADPGVPGDPGRQGRPVLPVAGGLGRAEAGRPGRAGCGGVRRRARSRGVGVRAGEATPRNIRTWDDLVRPGVEVIEPNPFTSGGARWNIMAAYGAQLKAGRTPEQAAAYLQELFRHVPVQDKSAREAVQTFVGGKGDVLLAYENEAINAQQKEQPVDYVVPDTTIPIENPIAIAARSKHAGAATAFVDFLRSEAAQRIYAQPGYRPAAQAAAAAAGFPRPPGLFTIRDLGGWPEVSKRFFDKQAGLVAGIERTGGGTGGGQGRHPAGPGRG